MAKPRVSAAGGFPAIFYTMRKAIETRSPIGFTRRMASRNACKTCALGMGGQRGGMRNEAGHFPEFCKKSVQAQAGDMQRPISDAVFAGTPLAVFQHMTPAELERLGRLAFPIIAEPGDTHYRRIEWAEALDRAAAALRQAGPGETFFYASGRSSNEAAFLLQLLARAYGTANIHNCSFYCHSASSVGLGQIYGSGTASVALEDVETADLALVIGANPASNHPRLITQLAAMRRRGGRVIVVNPLKELGLTRFRIPSQPRSLIFGSTVSDLYLQPHIGGDVALLKALLKGVIDAGAEDTAFIDVRTSGWAAVRDDIVSTPWETLVAASGVPRAEIDAAVRLLLGATRGIVMWAMGLTHHEHGVDNVLALGNLALALGWLGRPGAGLLPIRGHSNVQGVGSMGFGPELKQQVARAMEAAYGISAAQEPGQDTYASMLAAERGEVQAAVLLGGNLFASNPDRTWAARALRAIPLTLSLTTKLNEGHLHGRGQTSIVLPVLARDEEPQPTTQESMFNFVRLSEGGTPAVRGEIRSEVEAIAGLAERVLPAGRFDWQALRSHEALRAEIARIVPGYEAAATIGRAGGEFHVGGRLLRDDAPFPTADGRAHFHVTPLPGAELLPEEFRMMTVRSEGQFNTVVYDEEDLYRGNRSRQVVMLSQADADRVGLTEGQPVIVESEAGRMVVNAAITEITPGNLAMYYPEANVLVPRRLDPRSKTPAFKSVVVRLTPLAG